MTYETLTEMFGWLAVIGLGYLVLSTLAVVGLQSWALGIHSRLFGLEERELRGAYFRWLGNLKIVIVMFAIAPYIALKLAIN